MTKRMEVVIGSIIMGAWVIALELWAVYSYTGAFPWNL